MEEVEVKQGLMGKVVLVEVAVLEAAATHGPQLHQNRILIVMETLSRGMSHSHTLILEDSVARRVPREKMALPKSRKGRTARMAFLSSLWNIQEDLLDT